MCKNCDIVDSSFKGASSNPHFNLAPIHSLLSVLVKRKQLEIYAGDCPFDDMLEVLEEEKHDTVCFYLRCSKCGKIYFLGAYIRGTPIYKYVEDIKKEKIDNMIWGNKGVYYKK